MKREQKIRSAHLGMIADSDLGAVRPCIQIIEEQSWTEFEYDRIRWAMLMQNHGLQPWRTA